MSEESDETMTNLMNPTHSLSLALLLKPNGAGARERPRFMAEQTTNNGCVEAAACSRKLSESQPQNQTSGIRPQTSDL
jgi:hypothetical protein